MFRIVRRRPIASAVAGLLLSAATVVVLSSSAQAANTDSAGNSWEINAPKTPSA